TADEWAAVRDTLSDLFEDGWIHHRIDREIERADEMHAKKRAAGRASAEKRANTRPTRVETYDATPVEQVNQQRGNQSQSHSSVSSLRSDTGAVAPRSPTDALWIDGKETLVSLGVAERQAGSMIGKWLRDTGDDAAGVLAAIQRARDHGTGDPIPFVTRILKPSSTNRTVTRTTSPKHALAAAFDDLEQRILDASGA